MRQILHAYKFDGRRRLSRPLSRLLLWGYHRYYAGEVFDAVVPVPLHPSRLREREFNQATEMLRHLQKEAGLPLGETIARRVRATVPQSTLPGPERYANVAGAFEVNDDSLVRDRRILVVDDMLTTGNTVLEISRVLKKHGARFVAVLTVCRNIAGVGGNQSAPAPMDSEP
jgi:ComF family protein